MDGLQIAFAYDDKDRLECIVPNESSAATQRYAYDGASRLSTAGTGDAHASYQYAENAGRIANTEFRHGSTLTGKTERTYDTKGRLASIATKQEPSGRNLTSYAYTYNALDQRTQVNLANGAHWNYANDSLGQVVEGKKRNAAGNLVPGRQFEYTFDTIGNRTQTITNGRTATYTQNSLNQYTERQVPGAIDISGSADPVATVTVNGQTAQRQLDYFYKAIAVGDGSAPAYEEIHTEANKGGLTTEKIGFSYLAKTPEVFTYDDDGNLLSDGRFHYTWDAENRLIALESISTAPAASKRKAEYTYDPMGRRITKKVWTWDGSAYAVTEELRFLYYGWNLVAELDATGNIVRSHMWGLDLSNTMQNAGGVGGLLCTTSFGSETEQWFPAYDGNGNVMEMVNSSTGNSQVQLEYDPFGGEMRATGSALAQTKFRFSSKYIDQENDLVYYGLDIFLPLLVVGLVEIRWKRKAS